jgi:hypothetical protein
LFFSRCGSVAAPREAAWAPWSSTCDAQRAASVNSLAITIKYLRHKTSDAAVNGMGATAK